MQRSPRSGCLEHATNILSSHQVGVDIVPGQNSSRGDAQEYCTGTL